MAVLNQVGTISCDSEMLKMSVMTSTSWHKFLVHSQVFYQAQQPVCGPFVSDEMPVFFHFVSDVVLIHEGVAFGY